jgi:hypothetical protein
MTTRKRKPFDVTNDYWECPESGKDKNADRDRLYAFLIEQPEYIICTEIDRLFAWPAGRTAKVGKRWKSYFKVTPEYVTHDGAEHSTKSNFIQLHPHLMP